MWIDSHNHLAGHELFPYAAKLLDFCQEQGLSKMLVASAQAEDWPRLQELSALSKMIIPAYGLHPMYAGQWNKCTERKLVDILCAAPQACVGEIGLDRWISPRTEGQQEQIFQIQLELGLSLGRPIVLHVLKAWGWIMPFLRRYFPAKTPALIHAANCSLELAAELADMGFYFSFAGDTVHSPKKQLLLARVPRHRFLLESDAPDLHPGFHLQVPTLLGLDRGWTNPALVPLLAAWVSSFLQLDLEELRLLLQENFNRFIQGGGN